ncbi:MAG: hypothetical protein ABEJ57_09450 [Halobacteriaceae archaeon]
MVPAFYGGGIDNINLTMLVGLLLAFVGGAFLLVEAATFVYRERDGRTEYHRSRRAHLRRLGLAAAAMLLGLAVIFGTGPGSQVP